jgi:hypothetical protein
MRPRVPVRAGLGHTRTVVGQEAHLAGLSAALLAAAHSATEEGVAIKSLRNNRALSQSVTSHVTISPDAGRAPVASHCHKGLEGEIL